MESQIRSKVKKKKESTFFCYCNDTFGCFLTARGITSMSYIMINVTVTMCTSSFNCQVSVCNCCGQKCDTKADRWPIDVLCCNHRWELRHTHAHTHTELSKNWWYGVVKVDRQRWNNVTTGQSPDLWPLHWTLGVNGQITAIRADIRSDVVCWWGHLGYGGVFCVSVPRTDSIVLPQGYWTGCIGQLRLQIRDWPRVYIYEVIGCFDFMNKLGFLLPSVNQCIIRFINHLFLVEEHSHCLHVDHRLCLTLLGSWNPVGSAFLIKP